MKTKIALIRPGIHQTDIDFSMSLTKKGYSVFLLVPESVSVKIQNTKFLKIIKYKVFNKRYLKDYPIPSNLYSILEDINPDLIQPNEDFQIYSWIASHFCQKKKKHLVLISEKYTSPSLFNELIIRIIDFVGLSSFVWDNSKVIISHGSETTKFLLERGCKRKIFNLPIGVNIKDFPHKKRYSKEKTIKLVSVARFIPHKGLDVLLRALTYSREVKVLIVGKGKLRKEINSLVKHLVLDKKVDILESEPHNKLYQLFYKSDIYICSSRREIASTTIPEAMSCGLPIIVTSAGSSKDFIKDWYNGFIFKSENPRDLSNKINKFIKNPKLIEVMGKRSRKIAETKLNWDILINKYTKLFDQK